MGKQELEPYTVIIDSSEKKGWHFDLDEMCAGSVVQNLYTGDYTYVGGETTFIIERKASVSELARNIGQNRFQDVINRMTPFRHKFLILEFNFDDILRFPVGSDIPQRVWSKIRINIPYMISKLAKYQTEHGVQVIYAGDRSNAVTIAKSLIVRARYLDG